MKHLKLRVAGCQSEEASRPVRGGVPLAESTAPAGVSFSLIAASGQNLPLQTEVLATWPDGSAKWVLLDTLAHPGDYTLTGGPQMPAGTPGRPAYDKRAEQLFDLYRVTLDRHRDYGAMNWGDWLGERSCNWCNHEYSPGRRLRRHGRGAGGEGIGCVFRTP